MSEQELERLRAGLRELARGDEGYHAPPRLESVLRDRFRQHHRGPRARKGMLIAGIAACLTIVFAGGTVMVRRSLSTPLSVDAPRERAPELRPRIAEKTTPPLGLRAVPGRPRQRMSVKAEVEREVMTGFIPVGLGATFGPGERGSLVRVRLPRSALATFGLPMNENRAADVVDADVLLGEDGLARAIRFVQ